MRNLECFRVLRRCFLVVAVRESVFVYLDKSLTVSGDCIGDLCCSVMYDYNSSNVPMCFNGVLQTRINI